MSSTESGLEKTLEFLQSDEFDKLIAATKEFWDECDYMKKGASEEEIAVMQAHCQKQFGVTVPEGYVAFLRKENGLRYNYNQIYDVEFFTCTDGYRETDWSVFEYNDDLQDSPGKIRYLYIGYDKENRCAYDTHTGKYVLLKERTFIVLETYVSFAVLFKTLMMLALPANKLQKIYPHLEGWQKHE